MGSLLMDIQSQVDKYIQMIRAVFDVDVDMVDHEMIRVAGTGKNNRMLGKKLTSGRLSAITMQRKQPVVLDNPQESDLCQGCINLKHCANYCRICFPLVYDGTVYGAISIIALTEEQNSELIRRKEQFMLFMNTICDLISLKIRESQDMLVIAYNANLQEKLINVIGESLMILDELGHIQFINKRCEKTLGCNLVQIQYLTKIKQFSVTSLKSDTETNRAEYRIKIRDTKIKLSGFEYETEAIDPEKVNKIFVFTDIRTLHESLAHDDANNKQSFDTMIGESVAFQQAVEACKKAAFHMTPIMLTGEVGSGKEIFARAIHNESTLRHNQFIRLVHGSAIQELIEKAVFDRHQLSGAMVQNDLLDGNTLYIDEVSSLSIENQRILLSIIQGGRMINTRVICSTSKSLMDMVESGDFHPELYYALETYSIHIPPIRARGRDVFLFAEYYLKIANHNAHKNISLSKEVLTMLHKYSWRGNIREIENTITYMVEHIEADEAELGAEDLPAYVRKKFQEDTRSIYNLEQNEKQLIIRALNELSADSRSKSMVARELGISKATLYRKMKEYDIKQNMMFE